MDHAPHPSPEGLPPETLGQHVILVDGQCVFCNRLVGTIARHDTRGRFYFLHIQTPLGRATLARHGHDPSDVDSVYLLADAGTARERLLIDGAAGRVVWPTLFRFAAVLRLVPLWLLNLQYRLFARVRYRLFGSSPTCIVPPPELRARVLSPSLPEG